jgi:hypothetical protein
VTAPPEIEITPEPSPEERAAIEAAVASLLGNRLEASAWWRAGVLESTEEPDD